MLSNWWNITVKSWKKKNKIKSSIRNNTRIFSDKQKDLYNYRAHSASGSFCRQWFISKWFFCCLWGWKRYWRYRLPKTQFNTIQMSIVFAFPGFHINRRYNFDCLYGVWVYGMCMCVCVQKSFMNKRVECESETRLQQLLAAWERCRIAVAMLRRLFYLFESNKYSLETMWMEAATNIFWCTRLQ